MRKAAICIALAAAVFFAAPSPAKCAAKDEVIGKEKRLEDVKRRIRDEKKGVRAAAEKETSILGEIDEVNRRLSASRAELERLDAAVRRNEADATAAQKAIRKLDAEHKALSARLSTRLKAMYKMRRGEPLKLIFSSADSASLERRHRYITMIMDSDAELIRDYESNLKGLESERRRLDASRRALESAKAAASASRREAEALKTRKTAILRDVRGEKTRRERMVGELEQAAKELEELIRSLRSYREDDTADGRTGFAAMKGRLPMPVKGQVVSRYGRVKHPKFQTITFNNGIIIEAGSGTPAKSVYEGTVVYVGWIKGYGQVLIVDHGGGYYTLFAHLDGVLKEKGSLVEAGTEVGLVGESGFAGAPGLYFEIRQKGVPRDPMPWFSAR